MDTVELHVILPAHYGGDTMILIVPTLGKVRLQIQINVGHEAESDEKADFRVFGHRKTLFSAVFYCSHVYVRQ